MAPELDPVARMILAEAELVGELSSQLQAGLVCRVRPLARSSYRFRGRGTANFSILLISARREMPSIRAAWV